jgi:hypothetical protein
MISKSFAVLLLAAAPLFAADSPSLLMTSSGTAADAGARAVVPDPNAAGGGWTFFGDGAAFATYVSATGPKDPESKAFSTNWFAAGAEHPLGERGSFLVRGRISLEPLTIPEDGYPQLLQYVPGERIDHMRAHDLVGEAAIALGWRTSQTSQLQLYVAPVGDPALGTVPFAQRMSSRDFPEAPFGYEIEETFLNATRVVTAGWTSNAVGVEASVFHHAESTGRHSSIDDGNIDSRSARLTFAPGARLTGQISYGELGDLHATKIESASISYGGPVASTTALWTRRKSPDVLNASGEESYDAAGIETALRLGRNTLLGRLESVDRPRGFLGRPEKRRTAHFTIGYIFDVVAKPTWRAGLGATVDYHTQTRELQATYGHKPQTVYAFFRVRT